MRKFALFTSILALSYLLNSCSKQEVEPTAPVFDEKANYVKASFIAPGIAIKPDGTIAYALGVGGYFFDINNIVDAAGGSYVLKADGTVWLLLNSDSKPVPTQIDGLSDIIDIEYNGGATVGYFMALKNDGTVWSFGNNTYGQLGDSTLINRSKPVQVKGLTGVIDIACGFSAHSLALKSDGTVWGWGYNTSGELGDTLLGASLFYPRKIKGLSDIVAVSAGNAVTVTLKNDGTVWTCGNGIYNQLGNGNSTNLSSPVQVTGLNSVKQISAGYLYGLALKSDSTVWSWGCNTYGNLGDGTTVQKNNIVQVDYLKGIKSISQGCFAIDKDNIVWEWGASLGRTSGYNALTSGIMKSPDRKKY